jgi:hypothetical protein
MLCSLLAAHLFAFGAVAAWIGGVYRFAAWRSARVRRIEGLKDWPLQLYVKATGLILLAALVAVCIALTGS